eukprot:TRINITY_DN3793_c0_g2_i1.p1 TRINITY_DN3793_c0_g2~~TRINITY_DN3793_c0_g2_i1.p1  ORF type:complete len:201 (-),score=27.39 TRINITY_DN3793_c0_g2_i1:145-660(-)
MALYGWALGYGVCIAQDEPRGKQFLHQSKNPMARAWCILYRLVGTPDRNAGFIVLTTECDTSDPHVQQMLGNCYLYGWGCAVDRNRAVECFERAGNHVIALTTYGSLFAEGAKAVELCRQAAEQGFHPAMFALARIYEDGKIVPQDSDQARHWYTTAQRDVRNAFPSPYRH